MIMEMTTKPILEAENLRTDIYRQMSGEMKLRISLELYEFAVTIIKASILESHPDISESELRAEIIKRFYQ
jgi:hypothetical protein